MKRDWDEDKKQFRVEHSDPLIREYEAKEMINMTPVYVLDAKGAGPIGIYTNLASAQKHWEEVCRIHGRMWTAWVGHKGDGAGLRWTTTGAAIHVLGLDARRLWEEAGKDEEKHMAIRCEKCGSYREDSTSLCRCQPVQSTAHVPFCCPVCNGKQQVPSGFYTAIGTNGWTTSNSAPEECRSCYGTGIVWR